MINIFIPTWNNADQLLGCLHSLTRYVEAPYHVHILNNGDHEDAEGVSFDTFLHRQIPIDIFTVHNMDGNRGWQGALNDAYNDGLMDSDYTLILNDDVVFLPFHRSFLTTLMKYMLKYEYVGAVGPSSNVVMGSQNLNNHHLPPMFEAALLIGFCCMLRTEALGKVADPNPWDESLPGGDDFDMSIKLRKVGYKLIVDRTAYLHHIGFQTGQRVHGEYWLSTTQRLATDNAIARKHGVTWWFETLQCWTWAFAPMSQTEDIEGDWIRARVNGGDGLDVGCGANKTVATAVGVDRVAKGTAGTTGGRRGSESVADQEGDALALPFEDNSQDYIIARHIFEHLIDPFNALGEWRRVLRDDGLLIMACPNEEVTPTMFLDSEHVHAYTPNSLSKMLDYNGFDVEETMRVSPGVSFCLQARKRKRVSEVFA